MLWVQLRVRDLLALRCGLSKAFVVLIWKLHYGVQSAEWRIHHERHEISTGVCFIDSIKLIWLLSHGVFSRCTFFTGPSCFAEQPKLNFLM